MQNVSYTDNMGTQIRERNGPSYATNSHSIRHSENQD